MEDDSEALLANSGKINLNMKQVNLFLKQYPIINYRD